jgi:transcriptional regulator with XRE-family HTH domain
MAEMDPVVSRAVGVRLKEARSAAGLTQRAVAADFGISRQAVSAWERGQNLPTLMELRHLAVLYCVSSDYLLYGIQFAKGSMVREIFRPRVEPSDTPEHQPES